MPVNVTMLPIIAGLAVGIAFVIAFAFIFGSYPPSQPLAQGHFLTLEINGMKETYNAGEKIDFVFRAYGYEQNLCGYPLVEIVDNNHDIEKVGYDKNLVSLIGGCDPDFRDIDETWTLQQMGVLDTITIQEKGDYRVVIEYGGMRLVKEFRVQ